MSTGKIKLMKYQKTYVEQQAYDFVMSQPDDWIWKGKTKSEWAEYFKANIPEQKSWSDYAIYLVNSYPRKWVRESWRKKIEKSIKHWALTGSCVPEAIRDALLILSDSKDKDYLEYKEDFTKGIWWDVAGYTEISRMPIIKVFKYNEDSPENQVRFYITRMIEDLNSGNEELVNKAMKEILANKTLSSILFGENGNESEIKELPESLKYLTHPWCSQEDLVNIPSAHEVRLRVLNSPDAKPEPTRVRDACSREEMIKAIENGARRYFHDDVKASASWKRITIAILRGDVNFTYLQFAPTTEQKVIKSQGLAAFSQDKKEKEAAAKKYQELKEQLKKEQEAEAIEKEKLENL